MLLGAQVFFAGFVTWKLGLALDKYLVMDHNQVEEQEKRGLYSFQQVRRTPEAFPKAEMCVLSHSVMSDSATPCTVARQAPLFMGNL